MTGAQIRLSDPGYPAALREHVGEGALECLSACGETIEQKRRPGEEAERKSKK